MADTSNSVLFDAPGPKGRRTIRIVNWIAALIFVAVLVLVLMRLHNPPDGENQLSWELWKPAVEREAWTDFYLPGLWMTIKATVLAVVGAVVFGLVFGVGRSAAGIPPTRLDVLQHPANAGDGRGDLLRRLLAALSPGRVVAFTYAAAYGRAHRT